MRFPSRVEPQRAEPCPFEGFMILRISLSNILSRLILLVVLIAACALLIYITIQNFVAGSFGDARYKFDRSMLSHAVERFPNSATLNYRFAQSEMLEVKGDLASAEQHALTAIRLSPNNFNYYLVLASIQEARGDHLAAEASIRNALQLSPSDIEARWQLANLLVRRGRLAESLEEFRHAVSYKKTLLPASLDLVWSVSGGDLQAVRSITNTDSESVLTLARFLLGNSHADEAVEVLRSFDRDSLGADPRSPEFIEQLIRIGRIDLARDLWEAVAGDGQPTIIHNGSFEDAPAKRFPQFDWNLAQSDYARIEVDQKTARTGSRAVRITFAGRDTTRLDQEIKQVVALRAGARYRLECYVKTNDLVTPEGPRIVISNFATSIMLARSEPVASGTSDWQLLAFDFVAPQSDKSNSTAIQISIKRTPKYAYDDPTRGTIWFDDFTITEQPLKLSK